MARTENMQEPAVGSENTLTKTPMVTENPNDNSEPVSPEGELIFVKPNCPHLNAAVNVNSIRKSIIKNGSVLSMTCGSCKTSSVNGDQGKIEDLILCMKCGEGCCASHVLRHFTTARSEPHLLYVNTNDWLVKCMECKSEIPADVNGRLRESISLLRNSQNKSKPTVEVSKTEIVSLSSAMESTSSTAFSYRSTDTLSPLPVTIGVRPTSSLLPPRGLSNLGNTCFFNSVLQCLARTPFLVETLLEMKEPGERVIMKLEGHDPIEVELHEKWGPLTEDLVSTLIRITTASGNAYTPIHLLESLRSKHRQFMGYNQHDAHELLRTLLDCVKNEDLRRYRMEILRHFGLSRRTNPDEVDEKKKALAKEMDKKLTEIVNVRPDPVFRGFTVSANTCIKCSHKSEIPESFLDLSLPVSFLRLQPLSINRRKNEFGEKSKSKHQLKKEQKLARKNKKSIKMKNRFGSSDDQKNKNIEKISTETKGVHESVYGALGVLSPAQRGSNNSMSNENSNEILAEALNEINATPLNNTMCVPQIDASVKSVDDGSIGSLPCKTPYGSAPITDTSAVCANDRETPNERFSDKDVVFTSSCDLANAEQVNHELSGYFELPVIVAPPLESPSACPSANSFSCNTLKLNNNTGAGSGSSGGEDDDDCLDDENEDEDKDAEDTDEEDGLVEDNVLEARGLCMTLQPQPTMNDEENSIWACLREYTKCEVLTGNNKVVCEKCSKEASKNVGEKKQIYRNFTKQLLIKSPPPVLILHLKRFEAKGAFSFRKVDTPISFPLILDVGSFCSATCERLLYPEQKKILYSLYGIVEHSGSLNAGHYVAYVKVRNPNEHSYRRLFISKSMNDHSESFSDTHFNQMLKELQNEEKQWYYISDSMVRPIAEEDVLRKQAYLLFYERIW